MKRESGTKVLIIEDCRDGAPAAGLVGVYEGDFPRSVLCKIGDDLHEYDYVAWVQWLENLPDDAQHPPEWREGEPEPEGDCYFVLNNPRIRLLDGSVIWGDECWWGDAETAPPLEKAQAYLENHKIVLREMMHALENFCPTENTHDDQG